MDMFKCEKSLLLRGAKMKNNIFMKYLIIFLFTLDINATNYFLGEAIIPIMDKYRAESFVANRVYTGVEGSSEFYTDTKFLYLQKYYNDLNTGLNMGFYIDTEENGSSSSTPKYIIAFGGTGAANIKTESIIIKDYSVSSGLDLIQDILTDLNFLNNRELSILQAKQALDKTNEIIKDFGIKKSNITLVGHSLGGALVQYVSKHTGIKGVTFNTAPYPIYGNIAFNTNAILDQDIDVVNIMTDQDELTATLIYIENLEKESSGMSSHVGELITKIPVQVTIASNILDDLVKKHIYVDIDFSITEAKDKLIQTLAGALANFSQKTFNDTVKDTLKNRFIKILGFSKPLTMEDLEYMNAKSHYYLALSYLIAKDYSKFVLYIKKAFNINTQIKLTKLFYGTRVVIKTNTGHSSKDLILKSYMNFSETDARANDINRHLQEAQIKEFVRKKYIGLLDREKFYPNKLLKPTTFMEAITKATEGEVYSSKACKYSNFLKENKKINIDFISGRKGETDSPVKKNNLSYPCKDYEPITEVTTETGFDEKGEPYPVYETSLIGFDTINISRLYTAKVISNIILSEKNQAQFVNCDIPSGATITECEFFLKSKCIIPNITNYDFRPDENITRAEFVGMVSKMQKVLVGNNLCRHKKGLK
ncbi:MAG: Unknown protein [uncultured Sulfurovum sp.]|uniref:SLH domain-containing protein n=1 Tax=uncultured Sulfurovum sp. TaxID=269237 RepID=A0A6S6T4C1_9BACT|nr:MAG: Unknown protein [uncultured Sulfurovum sp.]